MQTYQFMIDIDCAPGIMGGFTPHRPGFFAQSVGSMNLSPFANHIQINEWRHKIIIHYGLIGEEIIQRRRSRERSRIQTRQIEFIPKGGQAL